MRHFLLVTSVATLAMSGCATTPSESYARLATTTNASSVDSAFRLQGSTQSLQAGVDLELRITDQNPVVEHDGVRGNFQRIELRPSSSGSITIQVESLCDCLGFEKYAVIPKLFLASTNGTPVEARLTSRRSLQPAFIKPARILSVWKVDVAVAMPYTAIVMADNSRVGQPIVTMTSPSSIYGGVPGVFIATTSEYQLKAYPFGKLTIRFE